MWFLPISILVTTTILAIPLSRYLAWIMDGKYRPPRLLRWFEDRLNSGALDWKQYTGGVANLQYGALRLWLYRLGTATLDAAEWTRQGNAGPVCDLP